MAGMSEAADVIAKTMRRMSEDANVKRFEPELRNHDGFRHHGHRFEIVGGISAREVAAKTESPMMRLIRAKRHA
jgi:hypothetical protein